MYFSSHPGPTGYIPSFTRPLTSQQTQSCRLAWPDVVWGPIKPGLEGVTESGGEEGCHTMVAIYTPTNVGT